MGAINSLPGCPLCHSENCQLFHSGARRDYFRCCRCYLVFVCPDDMPSVSQEKAEYDLHENSSDDSGYLNFLSRLTDPLIARLGVPSAGLDFGCGPGPALHVLMQRSGHDMVLYDPIYRRDSALLQRTYDFVTMTEVAEHLHRPGETLLEVKSLVRPGGWLAVMTQPVLSQSAFRSWRYKDDPTHVVFYSHDTFVWLVDQWGWKLNSPSRDVFLLQSPSHLS